MKKDKKALKMEELRSIEAQWGNDVARSLKKQEKTNTKKRYVLPMFPYPSGNLHMGHIRVYTISDVLARFYRLRDFHVVHPIGWDAFGLPAENAAIERNVDPHDWTNRNIKSMKSQLLQLGCAFDWDREICTCDPEYYKWTQWIFLQLFNLGLAYRHEGLVNWDPVDLTVLASEQVDESGCSWRSGAKVVQKPLKQWFIKTSRFAKELYDDLQGCEQWKDIADIQRHWIGLCDVFRFSFRLIDRNGSDVGDFINVHVKRLKDVTDGRAVIIRKDHILNAHSSFSEGSKLDVRAWNPIISRHLPIIIAEESWFDDEEQNACLATAEFPGCESRESVECSDHLSDVRIQELAVAYRCDGYRTSRKLKDWVVSRQRYWGTPIPVVHCPHCGVVPVAEDDLPILLPQIIGNQAIGRSLSLENFTQWHQTTCPKCQGSAKRETDTLDTFFDSSWYYLRYLDSKNGRRAWDVEKVAAFMPVDVYVGGKEHAALHLFYARFMNHFLRSIGLTTTAEPFQRLLPQGMVMGKTYKLQKTGQYVPANLVGTQDGRLVDSRSGQPVLEGWEKMSKSKHNGIDPQILFDQYGTDMVRLLVTSNVSPQSHRCWSLDGIKGVQNWLNRIYWLVDTLIEGRMMHSRGGSIDENTEEQLKDHYNYFIREVSFYMDQLFLLNTAISRLQGLTNALRKCTPEVVAASPQFERCLRSLVIMLFPFAPHLSCEFWTALAMVESLMSPKTWNLTSPVWEQSWPVADADAPVYLPIQINGKVIDHVKLSRLALEKLNDKDALELAFGSERTRRAMGERTVTSFSLQSSSDSRIKLVVQVSDGHRPNHRMKGKSNGLL